MTRVALAILTICLILPGVARAQDTAKLQVTVKISAATPSFNDHRLVIMLYHNFPTQPDRPKKAVDKHVDQKFSHQKGTDTVLTFTLGEKAPLNSGVQYTASITVFDKASKTTHHGEIDERRGPFPVLTNGASNKLTVTLKPAP
jgi:hypothetical protein